MGLFTSKSDNGKEEKRTPIERYLAHLDKIFQQEPEFYLNESQIEGVAGVSSIVYRDIPEKGYITALTYGLSLVEHPDWQLGRPELCITVASEELDWGCVVGYLANKLRGDCPFRYGQKINFGVPISNDSAMDAFFIFVPSILEKEDFLNIDIGLKYKINIAGLYPIYSDELRVLENIGLEAFWHHENFDLYSVVRERIRD
jgi:hypothetical protein